MQRTEIPNLRDEGTWYEIGYATGDEAYPLARVRVKPVKHEADPTLTEAPLGQVAPSRIVAAIRASLVDEEGAVLTVGGALLIGDEIAPSWQFDGGHAFDAVAWLDAAAAKAITATINKARALSAAAANRLLPA